VKCLDCDTPITSRTRCDGCRVERERTIGRNRYRARVGIPLDAPLDSKRRGRPRTRTTEGDQS
jgi:hypothetical protein